MYAGFNIDFENPVKLVNSSFSGVPKCCGVNFSADPKLGFVLNVEEVIFEFLRKPLVSGMILTFAAPIVRPMPLVAIYYPPDSYLVQLFDSATCC